MVLVISVRYFPISEESFYEISRVVVESKKGVESIAATVKTVSMAAHDSTASSNQTLAASKELAELSEKLSSLIGK